MKAECGLQLVNYKKDFYFIDRGTAVILKHTWSGTVSALNNSVGRSPRL